MRIGWGLLLVGALVVNAGCGQRTVSVRDALPAGHEAFPWVLEGAVWAGSFDDAAEALGSDAETLRPLSPERVWLAVYHHEEQPERTLTLRCLAFGSGADVVAAYEALRPAAARDFDAGDEGCWTDLGVMFRWGRLLIEVFGQEATLDNQVQSTVIVGHVERHMPPGLPDQPE